MKILVVDDDAHILRLYEEELKEGGFSELERSMILQKVLIACGLNQDKVEEATKRFLAQNAEARDVESCQVIELDSTTSGELVSASESVLQE